MLITQNNSLDTKLITELKKGFNLGTHLHLPNTVFFESPGTYINTEGNLKCSTKLISTQHNTKDDWIILRKLFYGNLDL